MPAQKPSARRQHHRIRAWALGAGVVLGMAAAAIGPDLAHAALAVIGP